MASNEVERMKEALLSVYPNSPTWRRKVTGQFSEAQILAIYRNFQIKGKLR